MDFCDAHFSEPANLKDCVAKLLKNASVCRPNIVSSTCMIVLGCYAPDLQQSQFLFFFVAVRINAS
jgi:hypothetical protein